MGITMINITTDRDEATLFLLLTGRGRRAFLPYYQSVESYDVDEGTVIFSRLDCSPAYLFRVGVAGNALLTTKSFEHEIISWLNDWGVKYSLHEQVFDDPGNALNFFKTMRVRTKAGREEILKEIEAGLKKQGEAADMVAKDWVMLT